MQDTEHEFIEKNHPADAPKFEYDVGQSFKIATEPDPEDYWHVKSRLWNYDADSEDALVAARAFKQYVIASVSSLGANKKVVTEDVLVQYYETVDKETVKKALDL
jgi:hypothetical protein